MALALSSSRFLAALSRLAQRRGYAAAAASGATKRAAAGADGNAPPVFKGELKEAIAVETAWVPDPATGYYRPANRAAEVDAADLRAMLLGRSTRT